MMTIDEAIIHCNEVAASCSNTECSLDHMQLAKWLTELKQYRSMYGNIHIVQHSDERYSHLPDSTSSLSREERLRQMSTTTSL